MKLLLLMLFSSIGMAQAAPHKNCGLKSESDIKRLIEIMERKNADPNLNVHTTQDHPRVIPQKVINYLKLKCKG